MAKIFQTKAYKVVMGYVYGWGAAAVIIGALFKIMHFPGAGVVLTIGMAVEAVIFFLSAFEPAMIHFDWARVFPILGKDHTEWDPETKAQMPSMNMTQAGGAKTVNANVDLGLERSDLDKLKSGIQKIADSADHFAEMAVDAPTIARRMNKVSTSMEELGERTQQMNKVLLESTDNLTAQIKSNCDKLAANIGESADRFGSFSRMIDEQVQQVKTNSENYAQQISSVSKNVSALNALYELQINETKNCVESYKGMQGDMKEMLENVSLSLDNAKLLKQESQQLASNVASLNSVYGNMLSVINK